MKISITGITKEIPASTSSEIRKRINKAINRLRLHEVKSKAKEHFEEILTGFKIFSGKQAAICYAEDEYAGDRIQDDMKALSRFEKIIPTLHHSIADHVYITVLIEGIPKILAMMLNSLGQYATSERSGRYTRMEGVSEKEKELYDKWLALFNRLIFWEYPSINEKMRQKLAMENARYVLSVFAPTTMSYTTSLRQFNYILDWIDRFCKSVTDHSPEFYKRLVPPMSELREKLSFLYVDGLRDMKNRQISFFAAQVNSPSLDVDENYGGETYTVIYDSSFAALAQTQRHRTLSYKMIFDGRPDFFYIPPILYESERARELDLGRQWIKDLQEIADVYPQATRVTVVESGEVEKFFLKYTERVCGRAQLEIARQTTYTYKKLLAYSNRYGDGIKNLIESFRIIQDDGIERVKAKCDCLACKEPCIWGRKQAVSRMI